MNEINEKEVNDLFANFGVTCKSDYPEWSDIENVQRNWNSTNAEGNETEIFSEQSPVEDPNSLGKAMFPKSRMVFVNISSILALQPLTTWGNYCGGKAAR